MAGDGCYDYDLRVTFLLKPVVAMELEASKNEAIQLACDRSWARNVLRAGSGGIFDGAPDLGRAEGVADVGLHRVDGKEIDVLDMVDEAIVKGSKVGRSEVDSAVIASKVGSYLDAAAGSTKRNLTTLQAADNGARVENRVRVGTVQSRRARTVSGSDTIVVAACGRQSGRNVANSNEARPCGSTVRISRENADDRECTRRRREGDLRFALAKLATGNGVFASNIESDGRRRRSRYGDLEEQSVTVRIVNLVGRSP